MMALYKSLRAFTLIELLIVVGIISILATIATPNFLEAQTRAKVSRVKNDARVISVALESYMVDRGSYPHRSPARSGTGTLQWDLEYGDCQSRPREMKDLTTPISYISTLPIDIFDRRNVYPYNLLDYWPVELLSKIVTVCHDDSGDPVKTSASKFSDSEYVIISVGPDCSLGYFGKPIGCPLISAGDPTNNTLYKTYDPSNGTVSLGNIFRLRSGVEPGTVFCE